MGVSWNTCAGHIQRQKHAQCIVRFLFSQGSLESASIPKQLPHLQQHGTLKRHMRGILAGCLQRFVQTLIQPSSVVGRVSMKSALIQKVEHQVVLRCVALKRHHQSNVLRISWHRFLSNREATRRPDLDLQTQTSKQNHVTNNVVYLHVSGNVFV
jgi:hypothetical protein